MLDRARRRLRSALKRTPSQSPPAPPVEAPAAAPVDRDAAAHDALATLLSSVFESATAAHMDGSLVQEIGPYVPGDTYAVKGAEQLMQELFDPERRRVLDFGCGGGGHRGWIEAIGYDWHGVDYLEGVADGALETVKAVPGVSFYDGKVLPFEASSFDVVYSMLAFEHIQHIDVTFSELARVLVPGGSVVGQVAYLEPMHDYSTFNFTPYGMKLAAERNGLELVLAHPKHDAFSFLLRRLLIITGSPDDMPLNAMLGPEGLLHTLIERAGERLGMTVQRINLLRLLLCTHFVFHVRKPGPKPADAAGWLEAMRADTGGPEAAAALANGAVEAAPADLRGLVDVGIVARDRGAPDAARGVFRHILARDPEHAFARYELAFTEMAAGRHDAALEALGAPTQAVRENLLAARMLYTRGDRAGGDARLDSIVGGEAYRLEKEALRDFGGYAVAFPQAEALERSRAVESRFVDPGAVAAMARERLGAGQGFSMVRLGDGEGAFMSVSEDDDRRFAKLYAYNREDRARVWFAGELDLEQSGFRAEMRGLDEVVQNADVLGVPYVSWLEHEYAIASITGISTLLNILRVVGDEDVPGRSLVRQTLHIDLQQSGHLASLLREQSRIGLISCHAQLSERLTSIYGYSEVEFHKLPGEKLMSGAIGAVAAEGVHYPDVFRRTLAALDRPLEGQLFLVAGGILGKFYCDRIKRSGGVALDVGSLVDTWVGARTRPGYDALPAL